MHIVSLSAPFCRSLANSNAAGVIKIWNYKRLTHKLRKEKGLPPLENEDDLPDPFYNDDYDHVLTEEQQDELHYQQQKWAC